MKICNFSLRYFHLLQPFSNYTCTSPGVLLVVLIHEKMLTVPLFRLEQSHRALASRSFLPSRSRQVLSRSTSEFNSFNCVFSAFFFDMLSLSLNLASSLRNAAAFVVGVLRFQSRRLCTTPNCRQIHLGCPLDCAGLANAYREILGGYLFSRAEFPSASLGAALASTPSVKPRSLPTRDLAPRT